MLGAIKESEPRGVDVDHVNARQHVECAVEQSLLVGRRELLHPAVEGMTVGRNAPVDSRHHVERTTERTPVGLVPEHLGHRHVRYRETAQDCDLRVEVVPREEAATLGREPHHDPPLACSPVGGREECVVRHAARRRRERPDGRGCFDLRRQPVRKRLFVHETTLWRRRVNKQCGH